MIYSTYSALFQINLVLSQTKAILFLLAKYFTRIVLLFMKHNIDPHLHLTDIAMCKGHRFILNLIQSFSIVTNIQNSWDPDQAKLTRGPICYT